jgi:hypothetical protein
MGQILLLLPCDRFKEYVQLTQMKAERQFLFFLLNVDDQTYSLLKSIQMNTAEKAIVNQFCERFTRAIYGDESFTLKNEVREY